MSTRQSRTRTISVEDDRRYFAAGPDTAASIREIWADLEAQYKSQRAFLTEIGATPQAVFYDDYIMAAVEFLSEPCLRTWKLDPMHPGFWRPRLSTPEGAAMGRRFNALNRVNRTDRLMEAVGMKPCSVAIEGRRYIAFPHAERIGDEIVVMVCSASPQIPRGCKEIPRSQYYAMVERFAEGGQGLES